MGQEILNWIPRFVWRLIRNANFGDGNGSDGADGSGAGASSDAGAGTSGAGSSDTGAPGGDATGAPGDQGAAADTSSSTAGAGATGASDTSAADAGAAAAGASGAGALGSSADTAAAGGPGFSGGPGGLGDSVGAGLAGGVGGAGLGGGGTAPSGPASGSGTPGAFSEAVSGFPGAFGAPALSGGAGLFDAGAFQTGDAPSFFGDLGYSTGAPVAGATPTGADPLGTGTFDISSAPIDTAPTGIGSPTSSMPGEAIASGGGKGGIDAPADETDMNLSTTGVGIPGINLGEPTTGLPTGTASILSNPPGITDVGPITGINPGGTTGGIDLTGGGGRGGTDGIGIATTSDTGGNAGGPGDRIVGSAPGGTADLASIATESAPGTVAFDTDVLSPGVLSALGGGPLSLGANLAAQPAPIAAPTPLTPDQIAGATQAQDVLLQQWAQIIPQDDPRWPQVVALVQQQVAQQFGGAPAQAA